MAKLQDRSTDELTILRPQHLIGRDQATSHTAVNDPSISRLHASIMWNGHNWVIKDTSTNGTYLNGVLVSSGNHKVLKKSDVLQFGSLAASHWVLIEDDAPKSLLVPLLDEDNNNPIELTGVVLLPNEAAPEVTLYQNRSGLWVVETDEAVTILESGMSILTKHKNWVFIDANSADTTQQADSHIISAADPFNIRFSVSKDEEHVSMSVLNELMEIDLGERVHHYLMLLLARKRLKDIQNGIESAEQGWVEMELLCQQSGLDEKHINLHIYRFRKQLIKANPAAMQLLQIIERRRGMLRFAFTSVIISGGHEWLQSN